MKINMTRAGSDRPAQNMWGDHIVCRIETWAAPIESLLEQQFECLYYIAVL
jgi:hypothetical protein